MLSLNDLVLAYSEHGINGLDVSAQVPTDVEAFFDQLNEALAHDSTALAREEYFETVLALIQAFDSLTGRAKMMLIDTLASATYASAGQIDAVAAGAGESGEEAVSEFARAVEVQVFALQMCLRMLDQWSHSQRATASSTTTAGARRAARGASSLADTEFDVNNAVQTGLDAVCRLLSQKLQRIWQTSTERDQLVAAAVKCAYIFMETESCLKVKAIKMRVFKTVCVAVKHQGHVFGAQTVITQYLQYYDHLAEPVAEMLQILAQQYDHHQLMDGLLDEIANLSFSATDTKGPRSIATFLAKSSELMPRQIMKQTTSLIGLLDNESYALRNGIIEVAANLICDLCRSEDVSSDAESDEYYLQTFFTILYARLLDVNPYCRSKVLQCYVRVFELPNKFPKVRHSVLKMAIKLLRDKSSNVRRNAVKLISTMVATHPFSAMHSGTLQLSAWTKRMNELKEKVAEIDIPQEMREEALGDVTMMQEDKDEVEQGEDVSSYAEDRVMSEEATVAAIEPDGQATLTQEDMAKLTLTLRFYLDAVRFITSIHEAADVITLLLASKNKQETIEAMDFFVIADAHAMECANAGIRRMMHLIWTKATSDEGRGVQNHLVGCYTRLYLETPPGASAQASAMYVARNLIQLTVGASVAELVSLEALLCQLLRTSNIPDDAVLYLWAIYESNDRSVTRAQRQGAILVLGMLGLENRDILVQNIPSLLEVGLGRAGHNDLILARHTCVALRRLGISKRGGKASTPQGSEAAAAAATTTTTTERSPPIELPNDHPIFERLLSLLNSQTLASEWYGLAEQGISAIYELSRHPDGLCSRLIRAKVKTVFSHDEDEQARTCGLAQLLFIVGHVAVKQIVYIEKCEADFKRLKSNLDKDMKSPETSKIDEDELNNINGTSEDDFVDAMSRIREYELLYSENSLLARFGPMVEEICMNNDIYNDDELQAQAALTLSKFMCVSAEYCRRNIPLFITILERSGDQKTRSNLIIAFGDIIVSFNHLVNDSTNFMYKRLQDPRASVRKTCLMTLTFLILAGQIKIKGQLSEMAKCLEDEDKRIADLAKMFFGELSTKDNAVYNSFMDILSNLSLGENNVSHEAFKRIIKFIMSFIEKERYTRQLSEKLTNKLAQCDTERHWQDIAYTLSLLPHKSEQTQAILQKGFHYGSRAVAEEPTMTEVSI